MNWRARARHFLAARLNRESYLGLHLTLGLAVAVLAIWAFAALLEEVTDNETLVRWDELAAALIHAHTTPAGLRFFAHVTWLGSPVVLGALAMAGAIVLLRRRILLLGWLAAFAGSTLVGAVLKFAVQRTRPPYGTAFLHSHSYSFPSGHALGATVGYGMVAFIAVHLAHPSRAQRVLICVAAVLLIALVGLSRIYLGVHYPSDVGGGFVAGVAWLAICGSGIRVAERMPRA